VELYINTKNAWLNIRLINTTKTNIKLIKEIKLKGKKKKKLILTILYRRWNEAIFFQLMCQWLAFIYDLLELEIYGLWKVVRTLSWRSLINTYIILWGKMMYLQTLQRSSQNATYMRDIYGIKLCIWEKAMG
jgi:hypothetical protein